MGLTRLKKVVKWILGIKPSAAQTALVEFDLDRLPGLRAKSFGTENPNVLFYVIHGHKAGFFSVLQYVLAHILRAEELGMVPVVDFRTFPNLYTEEEEIEGSHNSWDYYFEPISPWSLEQVYRSQHVFFCDGRYSWDMGYYLSKKDLWGIYTRYIRVRPLISREIEEYEAEHFAGKQVLGIHFRGNEQNVAPGHPFCPTLAQMFRVTDDIVARHSIDKIFLVTEEQAFVDAFLLHYKEKLITSPYYRTYDTNGYRIRPYPRKNHMYLLGKEVMVGASLLARCDILLHSSSNVSEFARFLRRDAFVARYCIENGVNSSNPKTARWLYRWKRLLPRQLGGLPGMVKIVTANGMEEKTVFG